MTCAENLAVKSLGTCRIDSPLMPLLMRRSHSIHYVEESDRVLFDDTVSAVVARGFPPGELPGFEPAGPRKRIYFDPSKTRAGIVTCGGLCPGLNAVVRGLTVELHRYGVRRVYGFRNGYEGFIAKHGHEVMELTPDVVRDINERGGTILSSSRGKQDTGEVVDCLERMGISILFVIGGDGTIRGAVELVREIEQRGLKIAVLGIPKTIDHDIQYIDQSFGFQTAFSEGVAAIRAAHVEATGCHNGIGLVKLMGRHSGFIACYSSLAMNDADFVLIPEVPFQLDGAGGFLPAVRDRLKKNGHAVIVVAEGAGQEHLDTGNHNGHDASGNVKLRDIGVFLKNRLQEYFAEIDMPITLKYIDPSYLIRSVPSNASDSVLCCRLAYNAVHAAMCGRTEMVISRWRGRFIHVPMRLAIAERHQVDPDGDLWMSVLESTGQPWQFA